MRINLRQNIMDYEGQPLPGRDGVPEPLRSIFSTALNAHVEGEVMTPETKSKIYDLTTKLYARKELDLSLDERKLIKDRVAMVYGPLVFGRVSDILENNDEREKPIKLDDETADLLEAPASPATTPQPTTDPVPSTPGTKKKAS